MVCTNEGDRIVPLGACARDIRISDSVGSRTFDLRAETTHWSDL